MEVPDADSQALVDRVIFEELCLGRIEPASREAYRAISLHLLEAGCEGVILGCTEIGLLLKPGDLPAPLFDTMALHVEAALDWALS